MVAIMWEPGTVVQPKKGQRANVLRGRKRRRAVLRREREVSKLAKSLFGHGLARSRLAGLLYDTATRVYDNSAVAEYMHEVEQRNVVANDRLQDTILDWDFYLRIGRDLFQRESWNVFSGSLLLRVAIGIVIGLPLYLLFGVFGFLLGAFAPAVWYLKYLAWCRYQYCYKRKRIIDGLTERAKLLEEFAWNQTPLEQYEGAVPVSVRLIVEELSELAQTRGISLRFVVNYTESYFPALAKINELFDTKTGVPLTPDPLLEVWTGDRRYDRAAAWIAIWGADGIEFSARETQ